jgi:ribonuclease PH
VARPDGRANDALRAVALERGANPYAEGSCLARFGGTLVHCTASVEPRFRFQGSGEGQIGGVRHAARPRRSEPRVSGPAPVAAATRSRG